MKPGESQHVAAQAVAAADDRLREVIAEAYQVVGALAHFADVFDHPDVIRALDRFSDPDKSDADLLPWPKTPLAAERAKLAASDEEAARRLLLEAPYDRSHADGEWLENAIAAALAERGRVERERAAKIAECCWADRCDVADEIRNQTTNDEA